MVSILKIFKFNVFIWQKKTGEKLKSEIFFPWCVAHDMSVFFPYILPKCSFHITVARFARKLVKLIPSAIFSCFRTNLWLVFLLFPISHLVLLLEIYDWLPFQSRIMRLLPFKVISHPQAMATHRKAGENNWNTWLPSKPLLQAGLISCLRLWESIKDSKNILPIPFIWRLGCYQNYG